MLKTPERRQWRLSGAFIINSEHISHLVVVFLLLGLSSRQMPGGKDRLLILLCILREFKQVN